MLVAEIIQIAKIVVQCLTNSNNDIYESDL